MFLHDALVMCLSVCKTAGLFLAFLPQHRAVLQALTVRAQLASPPGPVQCEPTHPQAILCQKLKAHASALTAALVIKDEGRPVSLAAVVL